MNQAAKQKTKLSAHKLPRKPSDASKKTDSLSTSELAGLVVNSGAFDWLDDPSEDIYTIKDGKEASWPTKRTNGAV